MSERSFPPSVRKLRRLRREGKIASSRFFSDFIALVGFILALATTLPLVEKGTLLRLSDATLSGPSGGFSAALWLSFKVVLIIVGCAAGGGILGKLVQTGGVFVPSLLGLDINRVQPGSYPGRMRDGALDALLGGLRVCLLLAALLPVLIELVKQAEGLFLGDSAEVAVQLSILVRRAVLRALIVLGVLAAASFYLVRWRFLAQHRMTLQEVREELRSDEGDPHAKSARRHDHMMIALGDLERIVRNAKVIVVRRAG